MKLRQDIIDLQDFIKRTVEDAGADGVVIGLSGGVDSAVIAALAQRALGPEKVMAVWLPYHETVIPSISNLFHGADNILALAKHLQLNLNCIDITTSVDAMIEGMTYIQTEAITTLTKGNMKARARMSALYLLANSTNNLVIGTTNKSEYEIGYFTKYGDGGVDFEPLLEFYKFEVREIARELELPNEYANAVASAGLWEGQTDEQEFGFTYQELDSYLIWWSTMDCENVPSPVSVEVMNNIESMINNSRHKRDNIPSFLRDIA
ncbi:MAG: NAD(+) synthase [Candidatus Scalindua sp.]|jgi:NAD+ synthase|nr:NAD(+) synthase [Candidatus Scalindua sp.]